MCAEFSFDNPSALLSHTEAYPWSRLRLWSVPACFKPTRPLGYNPCADPTNIPHNQTRGKPFWGHGPLTRVYEGAPPNVAHVSGYTAVSEVMILASAGKKESVNVKQVKNDNSFDKQYSVREYLITVVFGIPH